MHLLLQKPEHIINRYLVVAQAVDKLSVLVVVNGVGTVQRLGDLIVQPRHLRQLAGGHGVGQHIAVHRLDVGKTHGGLDLGAVFQLCQNLALVLIAAGRNDDRHHIGGAELALDLLVGDLAFALLGGDQIGIGIAVGAFVGKDGGGNDDDRKNRRHNIPRFYVKFADSRDFGDQVFVPGLVDQAAEQHQQAGHQREHRQHTEQNGFDQHHGKVTTDAKVHKAQRRQTADGRQRGGRNLRDCLGKGGNAGFAGVQRFVFVAEAVAQDDGVVDGERQLQNYRDRVGNKADGAAQKVGTHIQKGSRAEGHNQNRHLGVGAGGQRQHDHNDDGGNDDDDAHLRLQISGGIHAHLRVNVGVVICQRVADVLHGGLGAVVVLLGVKADRVKRRCIGVVIFGGIKFHGIHAVDVLNDLLQVQRGVVADVGHHDARRAVGDEVVVHHGQTLAGFGGVGQVGGDVIFHLDPAGGYRAENQRKYVQ